MTANTRSKAANTVPLRTWSLRWADAGVPRVCVTGGEPLAQPNCWSLLTALCDAGFEVSLETSGAMDITDVRFSRLGSLGRQNARLWRVIEEPRVEFDSSSIQRSNQWL